MKAYEHGTPDAHTRHTHCDSRDFTPCSCPSPKFHRIFVYTIIDTICAPEYLQSMKIAGIRELRAQSAALLGGDEPLLVTKHGRISGVYLPLEEPDTIPDDLRRELALVLGRHLSKLI